MGSWDYLKSSNSGRKYATKQLNLGLHYYQLPTGDRGANLQRSIEGFTEALRFYTAEAAPC